MAMKFLSLILLVSAAYATPLNLKMNDHGKLTTEFSLNSLVKKIPQKIVEVYEGHEKGNAHYKTIPLNAVLDAAYGTKWRKGEDVLFLCADGYRQAVPVAKFLTSTALIAIDRIDPKQRDGFSLINKFQNNEKVNLGPYYLVWDNLNDPLLKAESPKDVPYQVVAIDLKDFTDQSPHSTPPKDSSEQIQKGFLAFRNYCSTCHAINGDGGKKAIDLYQPANVLKRLTEARLKQWILDPRSLNPESKMLALKDLSKEPETTANEIIAYLKAMAKK